MNPRPPPCEGDALPAELLPHRWSCFLVRDGQDVKACVRGGASGTQFLGVQAGACARWAPRPRECALRAVSTRTVKTTPPLQKEDTRSRWPRKGSPQPQYTARGCRWHALLPARPPSPRHCHQAPDGLYCCQNIPFDWVGPGPACRIRPGTSLPSCPVCRDAFSRVRPAAARLPCGRGRPGVCALPLRRPGPRSHGKAPGERPREGCSDAGARRH